MRRLLRGAWGGGEQGITLLELLVALALFAIIAIGTLGALGATNAGGFLEGFPVAFATSRAAKDITAATVYVQRLQEYIASNAATLIPDRYCAGTCSGETALPVDYPTPSSEGLVRPYQLNWTKVVVVIERWDWYDPDPGADGDEHYCTIDPTTCPTTASDDYLLQVHTKLTWQLKDATRNVEMARFVRP